MSVIYGSSYDSVYGSSASSSVGASTVFLILSIILALVATVLAFIFIVPEKKLGKLNKFGKFIHNTLNFKYLIVEKILQALYIFFTAYVILEGFFMLFVVDRWSGWQGLTGILTMILGPIAIRLVFEFTMMVIVLIKNVIQINNRLAGKDSADIFAAPEIPVPTKAPEAAPAATEAAPEAPAAAYCTNCGAAVEPGTFCTNCGTKN